MTDTSNDGPPRFRSPAYPAIDLKRSIERARQLYGKAQHHSVKLNVVAEAWEYTPKSGAVSQAVAALNQFGLLEFEGSGDGRKVKLTEVALRLIKDQEQNSPKRIEAIKQAALAPRIHLELFQMFGTASGVADSVLQTYLTLDRTDDGKSPYSDKAANDLVEEFRATVAFAGLTDAEKSIPTESDTLKTSEKENGNQHPSNDKIEEKSTGERRVFYGGSLYGERIPRRQDVIDLPEGRVVVNWPERLSAESFEDIRLWFDLLLRKTARTLDKSGASE